MLWRRGPLTVIALPWCSGQTSLIAAAAKVRAPRTRVDHPFAIAAAPPHPVITHHAQRPAHWALLTAPRPE